MQFHEDENLPSVASDMDSTPDNDERVQEWCERYTIERDANSDELASTQEYRVA